MSTVIKALILHTGYVESGRVGVVLLTPSKEFTDPYEAIKDLASAMFERWKKYTFGQDSEFDRKTYYVCCSEQGWRKKDKFCPKCGKPVPPVGTSLIPTEFNEEHMESFSNWVADMPGRTADESGGDEFEGWWEWNNLKALLPLQPDEIYEVEQAEDVISILCSGLEKQASYLKMRNESWGSTERTFKEFIMEKMN